MIDQITVCTHCRDFAGAVAFQQAPETAKKAVPTGSAHLVFIPEKLKCTSMDSESMSVFKSSNQKFTFRTSGKFEKKGKFTCT